MIGFPCDVPIFLYMYRTDIDQRARSRTGGDAGRLPRQRQGDPRAKSAQGVFRQSAR